MNGCIYRTRSDLCMKFTTEQSISFCVGKKCQDRKESNADRIRSMTDEELTIFLAETSRCSDWCNLYEKCKTKTDRSYSVCLETWNDWLKEESEGE